MKASAVDSTRKLYASAFTLIFVAVGKTASDAEINKKNISLDEFRNYFLNVPSRLLKRSTVCSQPVLNDNVIIQPTVPSYPVQTTVLFKCEEGFLLEGAISAKCTDNGVWSVIGPICLPLCKDPSSPKNGLANYESGKIVPGTIVSYNCNPGFDLSGPKQRRCEEDGTWSKSQPICEPLVRCRQLIVPENSIIEESLSGTPYVPGSQISFRCNDGFSLDGEATITCDGAGEWSHQPPKCTSEEACQEPSVPENGSFRVVSGKKGGRGFAKGTEIEFSCEPHHFIVGGSVIVCQENGEWSAIVPFCFKVPTCSLPEGLLDGKMAILTPDTATIDLRTLSADFKVSKRLGTGMTLLPRVPTKEITLRDGFYHVGTQITFQCDSKYYRLEGSRVRNCVSDGKWSGRPSTCVPVCGQSSGPRTPFVTHGTPSNIGQWPWMVGLGRMTTDGQYALHCGATLISERWVVTAAHCVTFEQQEAVVPADEFRLYFGKYYRNNSLDDAEVQTAGADGIYVHPDYNSRTLDSDIALIRFDHHVRFTSRIQPVCLPSSDPVESLDRLKEGSLGVVIGWGETEDKKLSPVLVHTSIPVVSKGKCDEGYKKANQKLIITSNMFCAGYDEGKRDACNGDSGGPLVFPSEDSSTTYYLEGITSWGSPSGCGLENQYGGFVRVHKFVDWIWGFV